MISILHLIPTLEGGGAERQLASLAVEQARSGLDVHIGARRGGVHAKTLDASGVTIHFLDDRPSIDPRLLLSMRHLISRVRPSIIQTWLLPMDFVGGVIAIANSIPWIISERTSAGYYQTLGLSATLRVHLARHASAVVANSEAGRAYWKQAIPTSQAKKLHVVRNAINIELIRAAPAVDESFGEPVLLVVGRFSPEKAADVVVDGIARVHSLPFQTVFIGEGPLRSEIEQMLDTRRLRERVTLRPYQPDWWGWLKTADVLVSMSRFEGNPNVAIEAMAAGCPVILSDIASHREIADESSAVFVPTDDAEALARAICETLSRPDAAKERAAVAQQRSGAMTFQVAAANYRKIYDGLIDRQHRTSDQSR